MRRLALLAFVLAACGSSDDGPRPTMFGGDRPVDLKTPGELTPGKQYPLVLVLHGYGANGLVQAAFFGVSGLPAANEALVMAPDGLVDSQGKQFWNADPACCDFDHTGVDDVAYLGGLIDDVMDTWPVDPQQVYVVGHSNGGFMAYRMACERADVIAAIAPLAGLASSTPDQCNPVQPVNVLHMHGTADDMVPYDGAAPSIAEWAQKDGCGTTRASAGADLDLATDQPGAETKREAYDGCPAGGAVELWTIQGSGHIPIFNQGFEPALWQWLTDHRRS